MLNSVFYVSFLTQVFESLNFCIIQYQESLTRTLLDLFSRNEILHELFFVVFSIESASLSIFLQYSVAALLSVPPIMKCFTLFFQSFLL